MIVSFDQLVTFFVENPARTGPPEQERLPIRETLAQRFSSSLSWKIGFACLLIGVMGIGRWVVYAQTMGGSSEASLSATAAFSMPEQIGEWKRLSSGAPSYHRVETRGVSSQSWHYQNGSLIASVALDYPFSGWYDLSVCYSGQGWKMIEGRNHPVSTDHQPFTEVHMTKDWTRHGSLWFALVDERGRWVEAPSLRRGVLDRLRLSSAAPATYRVQVFITDAKALDPSARSSTLSFFEGARKMLAQQVLSQLNK